MRLGERRGGGVESKTVWMTVPDGEGGFVHLHAHKEGIFGKLDSGDEVERRLGLKADLHACPHEVQIHGNVSSDHQGCPEPGGRGTKKKRGVG